MNGLPLAGVRVAVTRPAGQADELARPLRAVGADVLLAPLIRVAPAELAGELLQAAQHVQDYDWVVFSSVNGVELFAAAARASGSKDALRRAHVACVGPATAAAAERLGLRVQAVPEEFVGDAIAEALVQQGNVRGARILLARAGGARAMLPLLLRKHGAIVDDVEVYHSVPDEQGAQALRTALQSDAVDLLTFTSPSAIRYFAERIGAAGRARVAVIGPVTAEAARAAGLRVHIEAVPHTVEGLVADVIQYFGTNAGTPEES